MENNNIDKTFNEASKTLEEPATFPGFDKVWATVEERLDKKQEKKKIIPMWLPYGIAASLLIGSGIFYFTSKKNNEELAKPVIAQNSVSQKHIEIAVPEHIQKIDSTVKVNIQNEIVPPSPGIIAYEPIAPKIYSEAYIAPSLPAYDVAVSQAHEDAVPPVAESKIDTLKRKNIEEVIAMGIRKEKASMVNALAASSSSKKILSELNAIADTAEVAYPAAGFDWKQSAKEPEILAYNKGAIKNKPITSNNGWGNRIGEKQNLNSLRGYAPGVNINSISGMPGSGKVDISISCQGSSKSDTNPLIIIDGMVSDFETFRKMDPKKIERISVVKKVKTETLFSGKARNGLIVVQTKDISKKERRKLEKLLKQELPEK